MNVKDLRIDSGLGTHINDGSSKYAPGDKMPQSERKAFNSNIELQSMGKLDTQVSRPCAIIGPDRVLPPTSSSSEGYGKTGPEDLWPCPDIYHQLYELPLKMSEYPPSRNISPRQTYQENMQRIMVPPTYSSFKNSDEHNLKNTKLNMPSEAKYCDVPFNINNEHKAIRNSDNSVSSVNPSFNRSIPGHGWQGLSVRPLRPYPAPEFYQYPDYSNLTGPRQMPMVRPQRNVHEESAQVYPERLYQDANLRFKPYPAKERYPPTRYEYIGSCPSGYPPPPSYPPHKSIQNHPYPIYPQVPLKYIERRIPEPIMDGFQRPSNPHPNMNTFRNHIPPPYGPIPSNCYQNKSYPYQSENNKPVQLNKLSYDSNNRVYLDLDNCSSKMYPPENFYYSDRSQLIRGDIVMPGQPPVNSVPQHQMYRKDNTLLKNYDYASHYRSIDQTTSLNNSSLSRLPLQFSPNAIAISPCDSNASNETAQTLGTLQEDCGYVSQSSTTSLKSFDNDMYRRHDYPNMSSLHNQTHNSELSSKSNSNKKGMNLRQFLQMWNEGDEDVDNSNNKEITIQKSSNFPANNEEQLYVLGLVNVPNEELAKYDHLQKLSKLPENIKGYNYIELLNQYEQIVESPSFNNIHGKTMAKKEYQTKNISPKINKECVSRPLSPLDVEAKISQSVIHKEVGCNFEIKPCSPKLLNVDIATPVTDIMTERLIEKVTNPIVINVTNVKDNTENLVDSVPSSCNLSNKQYSIESIKSNNYNLQDLETNTSLCLASLPQLDNDIELNFTEVNQQFINSTKTDMSMIKPTILQHNTENKPELKSFCDATTPVTNNLGSDKESSKLSKYRKTKKIDLPIKESEMKGLYSPSAIQQRIDSVIIKNPDNNIKGHISDNTVMLKNKFYNDISSNNNENIKSPIICYSPNSINTESPGVFYNNLPSETAIDFSLNKNEHNLTEKAFEVSNDKFDNSINNVCINKSNETNEDTICHINNDTELKCNEIKETFYPESDQSNKDSNQKQPACKENCNTEKFSDGMGATNFKSKEKNKYELAQNCKLINKNDTKVCDFNIYQNPKPVNNTQTTVNDSNKHEDCNMETTITKQEFIQNSEGDITNFVQDSIIDKNELKTLDLNKILNPDTLGVQVTESVLNNLNKYDTNTGSTITQLNKAENGNENKDSNQCTMVTDINVMKSEELYKCRLLDPVVEEKTDDKINLTNTTISQLSKVCEDDTEDFIETGTLKDKNEIKAEELVMHEQPEPLLNYKNESITASNNSNEPLQEKNNVSNITTNNRHILSETDLHKKHTIKESDVNKSDLDISIIDKTEIKCVLNEHKATNALEEHENKYLTIEKSQEQSCVLLSEPLGMLESFNKPESESNVLNNVISNNSSLSFDINYKTNEGCYKIKDPMCIVNQSQISSRNETSKEEKRAELGCVYSPSSKEDYKDTIVEPKSLCSDKLQEKIEEGNTSLSENITPARQMSVKECTDILYENTNDNSEACYNMQIREPHKNMELEHSNNTTKGNFTVLNRENTVVINDNITSDENLEINKINTFSETNVSMTEKKEPELLDQNCINYKKNDDLFSKEISYDILSEFTKCSNTLRTKNNMDKKEKHTSDKINDKNTVQDCCKRENQRYHEECNRNTTPKQEAEIETNTKTIEKDSLSYFPKQEMQNFEVVSIVKDGHKWDTDYIENKTEICPINETTFTYQDKNYNILPLHKDKIIPKSNVLTELKQSKELYSPWIQKLLLNTEGVSYNIYERKQTKNIECDITQSYEVNNAHIKMISEKDLDSENVCLKKSNNDNDSKLIDLKEISNLYSTDLKVSQNETIPETLSENLLSVSNMPDELNFSEGDKPENELISDYVTYSLKQISKDKVTRSKNSLSSKRRTLKRSLSESALEAYSENEGSGSIFSKRPKVIQADFCSIFQTNRRNSISDICNEDSVYILIDNDYVITEENEREKVCFTDEMHIDSNLETNVESIHALSENNLNDNYVSCHSPCYIQNIEEKLFQETWVDGNCVETMFNDDIAEDIIISAPGSPDDSDSSNSETDDLLHSEDVIEHMEKVKDIYGGNMCNNDAQLVETLYNTPQMNVNKTLVNTESPDMELISLEDLNCNAQTEEFFSKNSNISSEEYDTTFLIAENESNNLSIKKTEKVKDEEYFEAESILCINKTIEKKDDIKSNIVTNENNVFTIHSQEFNNSDMNSCEQNICSLKHCMSSSPEVTSTTSEEKNSSILLKISNYNGSRYSRINENVSNKKISYKLTESDHYKTINTNYSSAGVLITKAAQKYIPPIKEKITDLKVKLPLPQHSLNKLKQLKKSKVEPKINKKLPSPSNLITRHDIVKKPKPKFEDVLMNIDKIHVKKFKEKLKRGKDEIPKVVIKKNESGAHYASSSHMNNKNKYNPDLTGRKWQPWVFIEKNNFIDKMAMKNKQKAVYCHRKRAFVLAEKFRKYKSVYNAKFVISQPQPNDKTKGNLKYTIRLKTK